MNIALAFEVLLGAALGVLAGAVVVDLLTPFVPLVALALPLIFWLWPGGRRWVLRLLHAAAGE